MLLVLVWLWIAILTAGFLVALALAQDFYGDRDEGGQNPQDEFKKDH
jgi:hypothetical protein